MFGLGFGEITALVVIAVIVFGPDRLPELAKQAAGFLKTFRKMATDAKSELRKELGSDYEDLGLNEIRSLDPRVIVRDALLKDSDDASPAPSSPAPPDNSVFREGVKVPFDSEAT